jgi:hypothetical protein
VLLTSPGRPEDEDYLRDLGGSEVLDRDRHRPRRQPHRAQPGAVDRRGRRIGATRTSENSVKGKFAEFLFPEGG